MFDRAGAPTGLILRRALAPLIVATLVLLGVRQLSVHTFFTGGQESGVGSHGLARVWLDTALYQPGFFDILRDIAANSPGHTVSCAYIRAVADAADRLGIKRDGCCNPTL